MSLLQEKRLEKGLSVQETAQALGVSADEVRRWEAGELPDANVLLPLSDLLYDGETEVHSVVLTAESLQEGESCSATVQLGMMAAGFPRIGSVMVEGRLP